MPIEYALVQYFPEYKATLREFPIEYTYLIPMDRIPPEVLTMLKRNNYAGVSIGDHPAPELDAFLETCKDCEVEGVLTLRHGEAIVVVCQMF